MSSATEDSKSIPPVMRRKNGLMPSCENCRIAKARCDHSSPCERCTRQRKLCVFHPAPMSGIRKPSSVNSGTAANNKRPAAHGMEVVRPAPISRKTAPPMTGARGSTESGSVIQPTVPGVHSYSRLPSNMTVGYMGSTGFGAILAENRYASLWEDSQSADPGQNGPSERGYPSIQGASILAWLPSRKLFLRLLSFAPFQGFTLCSDSLILSHFSRFWILNDNLLQDPRRPEALCALSDILTENTMKTLPIPSSNAEWLESFSGHNSRWEMIGAIFAAMGAAAFSVPSSDPLFTEVFGENTSRKAVACSMLECVDAVLALVDKISNPCSLLQVTLLNRAVHLQSMVVGDTSVQLWQRTGLLIATVTALGLHIGANEEESRSALYREQRSQALYMAFGMDKLIATFSGRPPCLSRRFVKADELLDVPAERIFHESSIAELKKAVDENGWNLQGKIYPATEHRALYLMNEFRDEILELSLSTMPVNFSVKINDLRYRMDDRFRRLPPIYHQRFDKRLIADKDNTEIVGIAQVQSMHLHNLFLLERIEHPGRDDERLLTAARDLLALTVLFWSERDRYPPYRDYIHWCICCYGIPAGSALAIGLWKETVTPLTNPSSSQHRSTTIQNLSLFVACLEWVGPDEGNFVLCGRVARMIQNILDRALAPSPEAGLPGPSDFDLTAISLADMPAFGQNLQDWFDFSGGWSGAMQY